MSAEPLREQRKALYQSAEARVNLFNIKCLAVLLLLMLATESLTELGVFTAEKAAVRLCKYLTGCRTQLFPLFRSWQLECRVEAKRP